MKLAIHPVGETVEGIDDMEVCLCEKTVFRCASAPVLRLQRTTNCGQCSDYSTI
jgi:hypothetical protein